MNNLIYDLPEDFISVGGLNTYIQTLLEQDKYLRQIWITGEVSDTPKRYPSGLYFNLQDPENKALINCVIWSSQLSKIAQMPTKGEQLIILGTINLYAQKGQYQLKIWQSLPAGEGLKSIRLRQLKNRLLAEGLFDAERKRKLPVHPQIIAVVTSPQAAAWGDIQKTINSKYPGLKILFSQAQVQGELAPNSIVQAIKRVNDDGRAEVIILARGGGGTEDLDCFNDERVLRAIATSHIPIITGIGHERDETLADLVADFHAPTPTYAANIVVPSLSELQKQYQQLVTRLQQTITQQLKTDKLALENLKRRLKNLGLDQEIQSQIKLIKEQKQKLIQVTSQRLLQSQQDCHNLQQKLTALSPQSVLKRGYAVVKQLDGTLVRSTENLTSGEELVIQLGDGTIKVKIM